MIKMQGKDITKKGAAPGAVVTAQCDYRAVCHSIGIVGVITRLANLAVQGLLRLLEYYRLGPKRDHGGSHQISMV
jgi:hypothetical protein